MRPDEGMEFVQEGDEGLENAFITGIKGMKMLQTKMKGGEEC